jgi:hypothetical protein
MLMKLNRKNFEIAPGIRVSDWTNLQLDPAAADSDDWKRAIEILHDRIKFRFLDPVDEMLALDEKRSPKTFGFAVLAIDFLVVETLQGFREGRADHTDISGHLIRGFLSRWKDFRKCVPLEAKLGELTNNIFKGYRCALHHSGGTDGDFRVVAYGPMIKFEGADQIAINRTAFHTALKREFHAYLNELHAPKGTGLRGKFLTVMNAICGRA